MTLPNDPIMLLSVINTNLRDFYSSFNELCAANDLDADAICEKLAAIDYIYDASCNQFV